MQDFNNKVKIILKCTLTIYFNAERYKDYKVDNVGIRTN